MHGRRHFFKVVIRGGIFASLSLLSGALIKRWSESADCRQNFSCGNCSISSGCRLPQADEYRLAKARGSDANLKYGRGEK